LSDERPALVACDLDGTLLGDDGAPAAGVLDALVDLQAADVAVVICTGRSVAATRAIALRLGQERGLAIAYHGAVLVDVAGGRWLRRLDLPGEATGPLVTALREAGARLTAYVDDQRWVQAEPGAAGSLGSTGDPGGTGSPGSAAAAGGAPPQARVRDDLGAALAGVPVTRLIVEPRDAGDREAAVPDAAGREAAVPAAAVPAAAGNETLAAVLAALISRWPDLAVSPAPGGRFEVHHAAADKRTALAALCARLGVPASAVVACGDGPGDAGMLRWAGLGIAVAEGHAAALAAADVVVAHAELGGLLSSLAGASPNAPGDDTALRP
jgi:hydroxymethylpyrimidine pyrophosphatase-like HAD family hydrolase